MQMHEANIVEDAAWVVGAVAVRIYCRARARSLLSYQFAVRDGQAATVFPCRQVHDTAAALLLPRPHSRPWPGRRHAT